MLHPCAATHLELHVDICARQNLEGLRKGLHLSLATLHTFLVSDARVNAGWLEFLIVSVGLIQTFLGELELFLRRVQSALLLGLLLLLVSHVVLLERLILLRLEHEVLELVRFHGLIGGSLRLQSREVGEDHLKHANPAATFHASVSFVTDLLWGIISRT